MQMWGEILTGAAVAVGLVVGGSAAAASAWESVGLQTQYPNEGGNWQFGFQEAKLRSYYTVTRCHGSTVYKTENGTVVDRSRSIDTAPGKKSIAELRTLNYAQMDGQYFYRTC